MLGIVSQAAPDLNPSPHVQSPSLILPGLVMSSNLMCTRIKRGYLKCTRAELSARPDLRKATGSERRLEAYCRSFATNSFTQGTTNHRPRKDPSPTPSPRPLSRPSTDPKPKAAKIRKASTNISSGCPVAKPDPGTHHAGLEAGAAMLAAIWGPEKFALV